MGFVTTEWAEAQTFVKTIGNLLDAGSDVSFTIMSSASSVTDVEYNIHLSIRRIDSVMKWLEIQKTPQGKTIKSYIDSAKLKITKTPGGEQGKLIVFPSYIVQEITPVTKGTKYNLNAWVTGNPFK